MEEKNKKSKIGIIIAALALVVVLLVSFTYAYFTSRDESSVQEIKTSNMDIDFDDTTDIVKANNIIPLTEEEALPKTDGTIDIASSKATVKTFSLTNNGSETIYVDIKLTDIVAENFKVYDLKWALYENTTPITTGNFASIDDTENEITLTTNIELATTETNKKTYNLLIWIHENEQDQSVLMNKNLTLKISAEANQSKTKTLASQILENEQTIYTTPSFSGATDRGLFVQKDDSEKSNYGFPTYYYRGSTTNTNEGYNTDYIMNNYVKFGTYKTDVYNENPEDYSETKVASAGDDILWRVVRINEDGSIKLIDENNIGNSESIYHIWNSTGKAIYINEDGTDSDIKTTLNNWYTNDITINTNLVQNGNYCNDISGDYKAAATRITSNEPIFTCPNEAIMINEKVGLITADEVMYAGGVSSNSLATQYNQPYLSNTFFWTLTPNNASNQAFVWGSDSGILDKSDINDSDNITAARGVITLKADTVISGGNGSSSTPWIIE